MTDKIRNMIIEMHGLSNVDKNYTIYYDESNNDRLIRLTDSGLNIANPGCFALGGIAHKGSYYDLELDELKTKLCLQQSVKDMKLKNLARGTFPQILEAERIQIFLQWLMEKELLVHFSVMDVIYWSMVDIIDSILTEYNQTQLYAMNRLLKNDLYEILRADFEIPLKILRNYSYPNVGKNKRVKFINELKSLLEERNDLIPDFNFNMLRGVLDIAKKLESLPYLENQEPDILIKSFSMMFFERIILFYNSSHIFDDEPVINESLTSIAVDDNADIMKNFRFAVSESEAGIQISDVVIGLIGKCFTFLNQTTSQEISAIKSGFSDRQRNSLSILDSLIERSISESPAFAHYILSNEDMMRAELLFRG